MQIMKKHRVGFFVIAACIFSVSLFSAAGNYMQEKFNLGYMNTLLRDGDYQVLDEKLRLFIDKSSPDDQSHQDALKWVTLHAQLGDTWCLYFDARHAMWLMTNHDQFFNINDHGPILMKKIMQFLMRMCLETTMYVRLFGKDGSIVPIYNFLKTKVIKRWLDAPWRDIVFTGVDFKGIAGDVERWFNQLQLDSFLPCAWVKSVSIPAWYQVGVWGQTIGEIDWTEFAACLDDSNVQLASRFKPAAARAFFSYCTACNSWNKFFADREDCTYVLNSWERIDQELQYSQQEERKERVEQERSERERRERFEEKARREREEERLEREEATRREREESLSRELGILSVEKSFKIEKNKESGEGEKGVEWTSFSTGFSSVADSRAASSSSSFSSSSGAGDTNPMDSKKKENPDEKED